MNRRDAGPLFLLVCGLIAMVGVVLQTSAAIRSGQMLVFMILSALSGKRVRILPALFMLTGVVVANLFVPNGRVLYSLGRFDVTLGALKSGLLKGALLVGLIYMSRLAVRPGLRFPGSFGSLLLRSFAYFEALSEGWSETSGPLISRLDLLLSRIHDAGPGAAAGRKNLKETTASSIVTAGLLLSFSWAPIFLQ